MAPADLVTLASKLVCLGELALENRETKEVDVNPAILARDGHPLTVDTLIVME